MQKKWLLSYRRGKPVSPVIIETAEGEALPDAESSTQTAIFDHNETYRLYQCLYSLFQPIEEIMSSP